MVQCQGNSPNCLYFYILSSPYSVMSFKNQHSVLLTLMNQSNYDCLNIQK